MNSIARLVAVWQSRIALGLAFFGAVVVGLWPDHARPVDAIRLVACITTGCAWFIAELASVPRKVSDHDIALFERIRGVMNEDAQTFLLNHDFSIHLHKRLTDPINTIAEWHGPNFMFNDRALHRCWKSLFGQIVDLSHLYGDVLVTNDKEGMLTAWHHGFSRHNQPAQAHAEVKALNDQAALVYANFGKFVLFARKRLDL